MWWVIAQLVMKVLANIFSAELELGPGKGRDKRELVLGQSALELDALATQFQIGACAPEVLMQHVGSLVDGAVGLMNCFGVFGASAFRPRGATSPAGSDVAGGSSPAEG